VFVDASAIIGIIGDEEDRLSLSARLAQASKVYVSPIVLYEATAGLARKRACPIEQAEELVDLFIEETSAQIIQISAAIGREAIKAFRIYGKGRHKADLNMGDCFAYGSAKALGAGLLYKGDDFPRTDIAAA
jgi:ribonuclease VapC